MKSLFGALLLVGCVSSPALAEDLAIVSDSAEQASAFAERFSGTLTVVTMSVSQAAALNETDWATHRVILVVGGATSSPDAQPAFSRLTSPDGPLGSSVRSGRVLIVSTPPFGEPGLGAPASNYFFPGSIAAGTTGILQATHPLVTGAAVVEGGTAGALLSDADFNAQAASGRWQVQTAQDVIAGNGEASTVADVVLGSGRVLLVAVPIAASSNLAGNLVNYALQRSTR